jgi:hypothetical protein
MRSRQATSTPCPTWADCKIGNYVHNPKGLKNMPNSGCTVFLYVSKITNFQILELTKNLLSIID